ncbi:hypothetical protein [Colwellia sp. TT2012]|uniref:hypothetical protein n=1 Tax=Colwellia sp. TT2012 TaxID=1720342 RepID=UPI00070DF198|nr:hypothetical protein [Colwellia sp. TT2012]
MTTFYLPHIRLLLILVLLSLTSSCTEELEDPSEAEVTVAFFDAVYNKKDLNIALSFSSASFKEEIKKYKTINNFSRRMLNLSFDSVSIETQKSTTKVIDEFNVEVSMTVLLTGTRNDKIYKEVKKIQLIKKGNSWLVNKLLKY